MEYRRSAKYVVLVLLPLLTSAKEVSEGLFGLRRSPHSLRCKPGIDMERNTCRRRTFGGATGAYLDVGFSIGTDVVVTIPVPQLDTEAVFFIPFGYDVSHQEYISFPNLTGRSLVQEQHIKERSGVYTKLEGLLGAVTQKDGRSCLLRAMCEASSAPLHVDGLLGDVVNLLLSAGQALVGGVESKMRDEFSEYVTAEDQGRATGDCGSYHESCSLSFFDFVQNDVVSV